MYHTHNTNKYTSKLINALTTRSQIHDAQIIKVRLPFANHHKGKYVIQERWISLERKLHNYCIIVLTIALCRWFYHHKTIIITCQIGIYVRVKDSHVPLIKNENASKRRCVHFKVVGTVVRTSAPHKWAVVFDYDGQSKIVGSRLLVIVLLETGIH